MLNLSRVSLSRKLPAAIAALCLLSSFAIALVSYLDFRRNIMTETEQSFVVLTQSRGERLEAWFEELTKDVQGFATNPVFAEAINAFAVSFNLMIDQDGLQAAYIADNPYPLGERHLLDRAEQSLPYHFQHARLHPYFRTVWEREGYYDLFLFNLEGDLIYSVAKENDFATNLVTGPYESSGLGQAFRAARDGTLGQTYFIDFAPYAPSADAPAAFVATAVIGEEGEAVGIVAIQLPASQMKGVMTNPVGLGATGEIYLVGADRLTRSWSRFEGGFDTLTDVSAVPSVTRQGAAGTFARDVIGITGRPVLTKALNINLGGVQWTLISEIDMIEVNAPVAAVRNKMLLFVLLTGLVSTYLGWRLARSVVQPLARFGAGMQAVADKNYTVALKEADRGDEIGAISKTLMEFRDKLQASDAAEEGRAAAQEQQNDVVMRLGKALTDLAQGNLTHKIRTPFPDEYEALRENYNSTLDNLNVTIGSLVEHAGAVRGRADEMSAASDDLSRRTENQAATLEQTAAAMDELTSSVKSAAAGAQKAEDVAQNASKDAEASEPVVQSAVAAMTEIENSSEQISQIIGVIDDIAFQTNLLALNAGVEAARAGDAGRGFAVVASEVRALAQRSSEAAKQIKDLISASSEQVGRGVNLVGEAGQVLTRIAGHISAMSGLVGDIAAGAAEQSTGLGEINIGVTQLDKVTQQNAAMVEEVTSSSHALKGDATELTDLVRQFRLADTAGQPAKARSAKADTAASPDSFVPTPAPVAAPKAKASKEARPAAAATAAASAPAPAPAASPIQASTGNAAQDMWQDF